MNQQAQWIGVAGLKKKLNSYARFFRSFELNNVPEKAIVNVSSETYFLLYINGLEVMRGPVRGTQYLHYFESFDAAKFLHQGVNTVAALVLNTNEENFICAPGADVPAFWLASDVLPSTDESYQAAEAVDFIPLAEYHSKQTGFMQYQDLRQTPRLADWTCGVGSNQWPQAELVKVATKEFVKRDVPGLATRVILPENIANLAEVSMLVKAENRTFAQTLAAEKWHALPPERISNSTSLLTAQPECTVYPAAADQAVAILLDYGQDYTGFPEFEIDSAADGAVAALCFGEDLVDDNRIRLDFNHASYGFTDMYILRQGSNVFGMKLNERGGRYILLELRNLTAPVTIRRAALREHRYHFADRASFRCSDSLLERIWEVCVETLKVCTTDVFTDCPWRERSYWINDLIVENRTSLAAFGALPLHKRALKLAFSSQRENGWIPGVCPAPETYDLQLVIPSAVILLFEVISDYYMASGDKETVVRYLPNLEKILDAVRKDRLSDGTVIAPKGSWNFYDWGFNFRDICFIDQEESMFNSLYCRALELMAQFRKLEDPSADVSNYLAERESIKTAMLQKFTDPVSGLLQDNYCFYHHHDGVKPNSTQGKISSQTAHALALQANLVSEEQQPAFVAALDSPDVLESELYYQSFTLRQLHRGRQDLSGLNRIRKNWGKVLADGARTIYENAMVKFGHNMQECGNNGSLCHGFATAPLEFFQTSILGIEATAPGFRQFSCDPRPCDLEYASGRVPTPYGNIRIKWQRSAADELDVKLDIPVGCEAILPDGRKLAAGNHQFQLSR